MGLVAAFTFLVTLPKWKESFKCLTCDSTFEILIRDTGQPSSSYVVRVA